MSTPSNTTQPDVSGVADCSSLTLEETQELYDLLIGRSIPDGFHLGKPPKLSAKKAFTVIYMLQERYHVIPDHFEQCRECGQIFDNWSEGTYSEKAGEHWCGSCDYLAPHTKNDHAQRTGGA